MKARFYWVIFSFFLTSCTISFINMHTQGETSDLIDSTPTSEVDVTADAIPSITS